jgi:hypothetical protein
VNLIDLDETVKQEDTVNTSLSTVQGYVKISVNMATSGNSTGSASSVNYEDGRDMPNQHTSAVGGTNARNISAQEIQREMATLRQVR